MKPPGPFRARRGGRKAARVGRGPGAVSAGRSRAQRQSERTGDPRNFLPLEVGWEQGKSFPLQFLRPQTLAADGAILRPTSRSCKKKKGTCLGIPGPQIQIQPIPSAYRSSRARECPRYALPMCLLTGVALMPSAEDPPGKVPNRCLWKVGPEKSEVHTWQVERCLHLLNFGPAVILLRWGGLEEWKTVGRGLIKSD